MILNLDCSNEYLYRVTWMPVVLQRSSGIVCKVIVTTFWTSIAERMNIFFGIFPVGAKKVKSDSRSQISVGANMKLHFSVTMHT